MTARTSTLPGLSLNRHPCGGWYIRHDASRLPMPGGGFARKADAVAAVAQLVPLGIDWTQPAVQVRAAVRAIPRGYELVESACTSPEEHERKRRVHDNASRYLRALEADGATVVETTSYGLPGTVYRMSCGCERTYSVSLGLLAGDPRESLRPCLAHRGLRVPPASTDLAVIRRELGATAARRARTPEPQPTERS